MLPEEYERRRRLPLALRPRRQEPVRSAQVRPATRRDLPAVQRIYAHYVLNSTITLDERPKTLAQWRRTFDQQERLGLPFLVAESMTHTIVGYAIAEPWRQRAAYRRTVEDSIYLAPAATGAGLGRRLLTALVESAQDAGCREMIAMIADSRADASIRLHESLGFAETARVGRVGFKFGRWLGVITMQRRLRRRR